MAEASSVAVQAPGSTQPTNKVAAAGTVGGGLGAVVSGVYMAYGDAAVRELLSGPFFETRPSALSFISGLIGVVFVYVATKYGANAAAYNVLDAPNVPLAMAPPPAPVPPAV